MWSEIERWPGSLRYAQSLRYCSYNVEQGWRSGENACLPLIWHGLDPGPVEYVIEFGVDSRPAPRVFLRVLRLSSLQKI